MQYTTKFPCQLKQAKRIEGFQESKNRRPMPSLLFIFLSKLPKKSIPYLFKYTNTNKCFVYTLTILV